MKIRIVMEFEYELMDDQGELFASYGTVDPAECFQIDMDNDIAMTLMDLVEIVSWKVKEDD